MDANEPEAFTGACNEVTASECPSYAPRCIFTCSSGMRFACHGPEDEPGGGLDEPCTDRCDPGYYCEPSTKKCRKYCKTDNDCASPRICAQAFNCPGDPGSLARWKLCVQPCNEVTSVGCSGDAPHCLFDCGAKAFRCFAAGPAGAEGAACSSFTSCNPGLYCSANVCARFCRTDTDCPSGKTCTFNYTCTGEPMGSPPRWKVCR